MNNNSRYADIAQHLNDCADGKDVEAPAAVTERLSKIGGVKSMAAMLVLFGLSNILTPAAKAEISHSSDRFQAGGHAAGVVAAHNDRNSAGIAAAGLIAGVGLANATSDRPITPGGAIGGVAGALIANQLGSKEHNAGNRLLIDVGGALLGTLIGNSISNNAAPAPSYQQVTVVETPPPVYQAPPAPPQVVYAPPPPPVYAQPAPRPVYQPQGRTVMVYQAPPPCVVQMPQTVYYAPPPRVIVVEQPHRHPAPTIIIEESRERDLHRAHNARRSIGPDFGRR